MAHLKFWPIIPDSAVARLDLLGGGGEGGRSRVPKARAARGVQGHAPPSDFEL